MTRFRVATYNVHKCRGLDRRTRPARIAEIVAELNADVVALQEVLSRSDGAPEEDQAVYIASRLKGYTVHFGENRQLGRARYGNAILSRLPVRLARNYDLTWRGRERRGCLRVDLEVGGAVLHLFNVHLGTSFFERRHQGKRLLSPHVLQAQDLSDARVVVGDFNEWTRGLASRLMSGHFQSVDLRMYMRYGRTYPGLLPIFHLDHFYFDEHLRLRRFDLHRTPLTLVASDHLPMVAEFELQELGG